MFIFNGFKFNTFSLTQEMTVEERIAIIAKLELSIKTYKDNIKTIIKERDKQDLYLVYAFLDLESGLETLNMKQINKVMMRVINKWGTKPPL